MTTLAPDLEKLAVAWAKADADLTALLAGRVATRLPADWPSPFLRVFLVPGGSGETEAVEVGHGLLQWDAFAFDGDKPNPDFVAASLLARTLMAKALLYSGGLFGSAYLYGFGVPVGPTRIEEPDTNWARYMVQTPISGRG